MATNATTQKSISKRPVGEAWEYLGPGSKFVATTFLVTGTAADLDNSNDAGGNAHAPLQGRRKAILQVVTAGDIVAIGFDNTVGAAVGAATVGWKLFGPSSAVTNVPGGLCTPFVVMANEAVHIWAAATVGMSVELVMWEEAN